MKNIVPSSLLVRVAACATASILNFTHALAANGSWLGAEDAAWTNSANWSASPYPGNAVGESASFDGAGNGNTVIDLAGLSSILNVTFGQSAAAYTLGAGAVGSQTLTIENSGRIAMSANATADQTVSAAVRLGTTTASATYTFTNANANQTLTLAGPITGGAEGGTAGAKTLILTGYGKVVLNGVLSNGGSTGITLASYGTNTLAGDNTFSGNITVYDGTLRLTHSNALGLGAKTISANNNVNGRNPSIVLDGSAGDLTIPTNITFQTSNQRAGAVINEAGNNTILGNFTLTTGDGNTHLWSKGGKLTIAGNITPNATSRQLNLRGDADGEISGVIANGTTVNLPIVKDVGTGAWTLSGSNTFSGAITVSSGAITFAGEKGSATAAASINLFTNGTLVLRNTLAANHPNRIGDTTPIILRGGTLAFSNDGSAADFAETVGPLTATSGLVTVSTAAAAAGQTSTLTISSLSCGPNATLNFTGPGLGESNRNKIIINGQADGPLGTWATVNGTAPALYSSTRGVYAEATTGLAAKGDTLTDGAGNLVITTEGAGGPNALSDTVTAIASLSQNSPYASTVDTADKTLRAGMLSIAAGGADLTIGVAPNDGTLTPTAAGGELGLANNNADSTLTVNAVLADNTSPSSFTKYGAGPVVLAATNTLSGPVAISQGTLNLLHGLTLQNASLASAGVTFDAAVANRAFTLGNLTNSFTLPLLNTAAEPITLAVGNNGGNSLFGGVISGGGSLAKIGAGTLTLSGASTYNGGTDIRSGTLATGVAGGLGTGPVTNNATLNLTGGAVTYTALGTTLAGAGTVNVTLGTGTAQTALNGDYSNFTGTWNIGVGAASGAGKAQMNGADNADATINVLENATLYVSQPALHQAAAVLYGGTTGETYGQLRLEGSAEWAGPVTLVGDCLDPSKGFFGSNSGTGTISGAVSDLGGAHPVNKVGGGVFALANPANTYAGPTWVRQGSLIASTIKNVGEASSLGQPADAAAGAIKLGNGTTAARLTYAGTGDTTDRVIDLAGTTGAGYLEQSGTGLLKFTSDLTYSGAGGKSLYLHGSTAGAGELAGVYGDGLPYTNKLIKTGTGQWTLSAANTYRGETEIQEGTLTIAHPNAIPAASTIRMTGTASRNAVLDLANDGAGQTEKNLTIGVGYRGTIAAGAGLDGAAVDHLFNEWSLSLTTVTVTRAASVLSGTPTITVNTVNLSGGNSYRTTISPSDVDVRIGRAAVLSNGNLTKTLHLDGTSTGNVITGAVYNGLSGSTVVLDKTGTGTWTLLGSNTYSGATTVNGGTLALAGPDGAIPSTSSFTVNSGATLRLNNTAASNNTDRLGNAKALTLNGGTLAFSHTAGAADYSETVGAVTVSGAGNAIAASQASEGRTSTLSLASLTRTGNATLDFSGAGLGASDRNRTSSAVCRTA